jgi:hypothetical protein
MTKGKAVTASIIGLVRDLVRESHQANAVPKKSKMQVVTVANWTVSQIAARLFKPQSTS